MIITTICDIERTLQLLRLLERFLTRKNTCSLQYEIKKYIKYIMKKDFILETNVKLVFDSEFITVHGEEHTVNEFMIVHLGYRIFAPLIYYIFPELCRCGRMIVHKIDTGSMRYLVHRANYKNHPLNHPGGHIEYIEVDSDKNIYSGKKYIEAVLRGINALDNNCTSNDYTSNNLTYGSQHITDIQRHALFPDSVSQNEIKQWILFGTCREVREEAGLDLSKYVTTIKLIKLGKKTHYFSVFVDNNIMETGPLARFKKEIYTSLNKHDKNDKNNKNNKNKENDFDFTDISYTLFSNYYSLLCCLSDNDINDIVDTNTNMNTATNEDINISITLDEYWNTCKNKYTHHAWITGDDMKTFWNKKHLEHIKDVINAIEPSFHITIHKI